MITAPTVIRLFGWTGLLLATAWTSSRESGSNGPTPNSNITLKRDIPYRDHNGRLTRLDLYLPKHDDHPDTLYPAVLLVHGGSWIGGSKSGYRSDPGRNATRLAQHGIVVIAIDYVLGRPGRPNWSAALADLRAAIRWTRRNAATYRIAPDRIALLGQSAGGHLALMVGTDGNEIEDGISAKVQAVISLYGPTDLATLAKARRSRRDPILTLLGRPDSEELLALEADASPLLRISQSTPPTLLLHGTDDRWVPPDQARMMSQVLGEQGILHRLVIVEGARHGFETIVESPRRIDLLPEILAFLTSVWNASTASVSIAPPTNHSDIHFRGLDDR